jgi:DNA-binding NtrC family response regulator
METAMYQRTVLIVEDEFLIRVLLADTLALEGYDVFEAGSVLEAVAVLGQQRIDAIITDVDMPGGLSGLDLAEMVSSKHMSIPVIVASGGHKLREDELPGDAVFVSKPYRLEDIATMVDDMTSSNGPRLIA